MADYLIKHETLEDIADSVRNKLGTTDKIKVYELSSKIDSIEQSSGDGIDTSDATATTEDILSGKTAYVNGEKITGTFTNNELIGVIEKTTKTINNEYVKNIGSYAFNGCSSLTTVDFPVCTNIGGYAFAYCYNLTSVNFPACTSIGNYAFNGCSSLTTLILRNSSVAMLNSTNAFASTPMPISTLTGSFGSIYVPSSLVDAYKAASNWSVYASRITAIPVPVITFTIQHVTYQAESGMTWQEFAESNYNTGNILVDDKNEVVLAVDVIIVTDMDAEEGVKPSDEIIPGHDYYTY